MTSAAVEAGLAFLDPVVAVILAPVIAGFDFDTVTICGSPPPNDPGLTIFDIQAIANPADLSGWLPAAAKLNQWFLSWYWYQICECAAAPTPAAPAPSNPGAGASKNPGLPSGPTTSPCWSVQNTFLMVANGPNQNWSSSVFPNTTQVPITPPFVGGPTMALSIPPGVTQYSYSVTLDQQPATGAIQPLFWFYDNTGHAIANGEFGNWNGVFALTQSGTITVPANAVAWTLTNTNSDSLSHSIVSSFSFFCSGQQPNQITTPCCPPDPLQEQLLQTILGFVQSIYSALPAQLTSYAESTVHANLSGGGSIFLGASTIAVKVTITTDNPQLGSSPGDPTYLFNRGYIVPITLEAPIRGQVRLVYNPQLYQLPPLTESIGFWFGPGVIASITELVRGP